MSVSVAGGILLALGSAATLNWGYFVQHAAATAMPPLVLRHPLRSLGVLLRDVRWMVGFVTGIGGWGLYVAALLLAPLSIVQATSAGGIAVLAALVGNLARREQVEVFVSVAGLVLLGLSLIRTHAPTGHGSWSSVALWMGISIGVAAIAAGPASAVLAGGAGLGIAAGVLYASGDVGTKAALAGGTRLGFVPALLACHGLAFVCMQLGFQRGGALATAGMATLWTNALPIAAGSFLFSEAPPGGFRGAARVAAFACVVIGAAALARREPVEAPAPVPLQPRID